MTEAARRELPAVLHLVGSFHQGGSETQALQAVRLLKSSGRYRGLLACLSKDGVLRHEADTLVSDIPDYPLTSFYNWNACTQVQRFAAFLRKERIDVVQSHDFYTNVFGMAGAFLARVPIRIAARRETTGVRTRMQLRAEHASYRLAAHVVANANALKAQLVKEGVPAAKITVVYNGVDLSRFVTAPRIGVLDSVKIPRGNRIVTIVANMRYPVKDHVTFLRSAQLIASSVPDTTYVLAVSDVCVLTSRAEGFPNAVLEYMAAGKPVVSTNVGGVPEMIVEGDSGYIVPVGDIEAIADRVTALLQNPERAAAFGRRGREIVEKSFSCEAQLMALESLYARLLSQNRDATNRPPSSVASGDPTVPPGTGRTERSA